MESRKNSTSVEMSTARSARVVALKEEEQKRALSAMVKES